MALLPVTHFTWQCLRVVKRSKKPPMGSMLRLVRNRRTKDGSFLTEMVDRGLLMRVSGTAAKPFEATYSLTERGGHAAEYGECEMMSLTASESHEREVSKPVKKGKTTAGRGK